MNNFASENKQKATSKNEDGSYESGAFHKSSLIVDSKECFEINVTRSLTKPSYTNFYVR